MLMSAYSPVCMAMPMEMARAGCGPRPAARFSAEFASPKPKPVIIRPMSSNGYEVQKADPDWPAATRRPAPTMSSRGLEAATRGATRTMAAA